MMTKKYFNLFSVITICAGLLGCGKSSERNTSKVDTSQQDASYVATSEPSGAIAVGAARKSIKDKDEIVLIGRIGGSSKPFVDGIAAFTIVDSKVPHCSDDEGCPTPWDYCCEQDQVKENMAMVKIIDSKGNPVAKDARQLLGVQELSMVVVHGKARRDSEGNLAVLADQVFIKK